MLITFFFWKYNKYSNHNKYMLQFQKKIGAIVYLYPTASRSTTNDGFYLHIQKK